MFYSILSPTLSPTYGLMYVGDKTKRLNPTRQRIMEEIRNNPNITQPQLMDIIGIGKTAIQNNIAFLKGNGYIERVGFNKNGYWRVMEQ